MLNFKSRKGEIATLLTLGLVVVGTVITLASSFFISKKPQTTSTKAAISTYCCITRSGADVYYNTGTCSSNTHPCCGSGTKKPPCSGGLNVTAGSGVASTFSCPNPNKIFIRSNGTCYAKCTSEGFTYVSQNPDTNTKECCCKPASVNPTQGVSATCPGAGYKFDGSSSKCYLLKGKPCTNRPTQCCDKEVEDTSLCSVNGIPRCSAGSYTNQTGCEQICGVGQCQECMASSTTHKYECMNINSVPTCSKPRTYSQLSNCQNEGCANCTQCTFGGAVRYECEGSGTIQCPAGEFSCGQNCCKQDQQCSTDKTCVTPTPESPPATTPIPSTTTLSPPATTPIPSTTTLSPPATGSHCYDTSSTCKAQYPRDPSCNNSPLYIKNKGFSGVYYSDKDCRMQIANMGTDLGGGLTSLLNYCGCRFSTPTPGNSSICGCKETGGRKLTWGQGNACTYTTVAGSGICQEKVYNNGDCVAWRIGNSSDPNKECRYNCYYKNENTNCEGSRDTTFNASYVRIIKQSAGGININQIRIERALLGSDGTIPVGVSINGNGGSYSVNLNDVNLGCVLGTTRITAKVSYHLLSGGTEKWLSGSDECITGRGAQIQIIIN